ENSPIELDLSIPAAPRTPIEVMSSPRRASLRGHSQHRARPGEIKGQSAEFGAPHPQLQPQHSHASLEGHQPPPPSPSPSSPPTAAARPFDGKSLPRAYVARRRVTPRSMPVVEDSPRDTGPLMPPTNGGSC
ncbi:MAG TPA: hypothetical protein VHV78_02730, partial [Gemmatimonadaceae bacterium]|nr:hypothetical protein [Gemmatimonadaceae bacterium]